MKFNKKYFVYIGVVVVLLVGIFGINYTSNNKQEINSNISFVDESVTTTSEEDNTFYVDIKGAVKKPGVYKVSDGMIVNDLIKMAGGLTKNAYTKNINLASKLKEGMVVYVYSKNELTTTKILNDVKYTVPSDDKKEEQPSGLININTASKEELMTLSGVGESKAIAIIEYRNKNKFNTIEDIMNVTGIGESAFAKIKEYITV